MKDLEYNIQVYNKEIMIKLIDLNSEIPKSQLMTKIIYDDESTNVNSIVSIEIKNCIQVFYYIELFTSGIPDINIFELPDAELILLSGKRKSCVLNIRSGEVTEEFEHCLFWDFCMLPNGYILETGELDCLLRDGDGTILDKVPVDPPWDMEYKEDGIFFCSSFYGEQILKYPKT